MLLAASDGTVAGEQKMIYDVSEYSCDDTWPEIKCIMKRLYSDFIVIEIPGDGRVLQPVESKQIEQKNLIQEAQDDCKSKNEITVPSEFEDKVQDLAKLKQVAEDEIEQCMIDLKEFPKDVRKKLYQFITDSYGETLFTKCENGQLIVRKSNGRTDEDRKRRRWPADREDYLHFTMTKENMDTHSVINLISRRLRLNPSLFSVSGTKDRRAVTVQRICVYRVEYSRIENLRFRGVWLSDFCYSNTKLQLGDAYGNHFSIILRDLDTHFGPDEFSKRIEKWQHYGFLNYFGSQRFGACGVNTADIGKLILTEQWKQAVKILLAPRQEAKDSINNFLKCFTETGDANAALKQIPFGDNSIHIERTLLKTLATNPNAYKAAILALPRDVRTMYIHAYQSSIFNRIVTRRKKIFGHEVLQGDLDKEGNYVSDIAKVDIQQVCLPLPSSETKLPQNEVGKWYEEIAAEDNINGESFQKIGRHFGIGSVYRPFLLNPKNVSWELFEHSTRNEILQRCDFIPESQENRKKDEETEEKQCNALKIQFDLPAGTYATVALRELMRTDFSKESQKSMEAEILAGKEADGETQ